MFSRDVSTFKGIAARSAQMAFRDASYASPVTVYRSPFYERVGSVLLACLIGVGLAVSLVAWWS
jgi:hypothetical protein